MEEQARWATGKPGIEDFFLREQAQTEAYYGRLRKAHALSRRAVELADQTGVSERGAEWKASEALNAAKVGETTQARELAQGVIAASSTIRPRQIAALALAAAGDVARALETTRQLDRQFPVNTLLQRCELPTIRAQIYLQQDNPSSAIESLRQATPYELRFSDHFGLEPAYVRGEAYLKARQGKQAAEFRKVLEHRGIVGSSINGALAHLQLGRAQVMMGDKEAARKSYQDFLTLWKDADPDIPIYKQAKAEYARLR